MKRILATRALAAMTSGLALAALVQAGQGPAGQHHRAQPRGEGWRIFHCESPAGGTLSYDIIDSNGATVTHKVHELVHDQWFAVAAQRTANVMYTRH